MANGDARERWRCRECSWSGERDRCSVRRGSLECPRCLPRGYAGLLLRLEPGETVAAAKLRYMRRSFDGETAPSGSV